MALRMDVRPDAEAVAERGAEFVAGQVTWLITGEDKIDGLRCLRAGDRSIPAGRICSASPEGGIIADYTGEFEDPEELALRLWCTVGVVEHGLFGAELVSDVIVAKGRTSSALPPGPHPTDSVRRSA